MALFFGTGLDPMTQDDKAFRRDQQALLRTIEAFSSKAG